jgi:hypothetical protein
MAAPQAIMFVAFGDFQTDSDDLILSNFLDIKPLEIKRKTLWKVFRKFIV